jgi:UDP-2-acetamido-3-amino-2,3-dideoxy-glucuronate N-acetyltransferase
MSAYGHRLSFDAQRRATCPESGEQYELSATDAAVRPLPKNEKRTSKN